MTTRLIGKLPPDVEAELIAAASIADPRQRLRAIDEASRRARERYPHLYKGTRELAQVRLEDVRLAFPALFEPQAVGDGEPAYGARFIIDPAQKKLVRQLDEAVEQAAKDKWGEKAPGILSKILKDGKSAFLKEDYCNKNGDPYDGFEDMFALGTRSQTRPLVIDQKKQPLTKNDGKPYAGCYVNAIVEVWAQDNGYGRRINAQLKGVQFVRDGAAFGGGAPASADDFEDLSVEDDDSLE